MADPLSNHPGVMKKLVVIVATILILTVLAVVIHRRSVHSFTMHVRAIHVGDSKQKVEQLLGPPVASFTPLPEARTNYVISLMSVHSETWAYGSELERHPFSSEFPYFDPFRIRIFKPDTDDVAIEFDSSGKVSKVTIP